MRITITTICLSLCFAVVASAQGGPVAVPDSSVVWATSYDAALQAARGSQRQVLLIFETEWCKWCAAMNDSTWSDPALKQMERRLVYFRIDADIDTVHVLRYHVTRFPTAILVSDQGAETDRWVGFRKAPQLVEELSDALEGLGTLWDLEKQMQDAKADAPHLLAIGREYLQRGETDRAKEFFERALATDMSNTAGLNDEIMFHQAMIDREAGEWYKAIERLKQLIKKFPETKWREDAELYSAWLYAQAGDSTEAVKRYRNFLDERQSSSETQWVQKQIDRLEPKGAIEEGKQE